MTIPFTPANSGDTPQVAAFDGLVTGAAFSALNARTEQAIRTQLQDNLLDTQGDSVWATLWDTFWGFIKQPIEWVVGLLQQLFPWIDWASIPQNFESMLTWINDQLLAIPFFGDFIQGAETFVEALIRNLVYWFTHPGEFLTAFVNALKDLFSHAGELIGTVINSLLYWLAHPGELLTGIINFLKDVFGQAGELLQHVIEGIIYWITHPGQPGGIGYLLIEGIKTLFTTVGPVIETVINSVIYWLTHPGQEGGIGYLLMRALQALVGSGGYLVDTILSTISYWLQNAGQLLTAFVAAIVNWLKTIGIDLTGGLSFMQVIVDNVARFFGQTGETLFAWAQNLVSIFNLPALVEGVINSVMAVVNIGQINVEERKNLLNMGVFQTSSTLEAVNGWSWDSGKNRSGTIGGSAKLTCSSPGTVRTLYSNQNIRVASGDRIGGSAFINTSSFNGGSGAIQLVLITFAGTVKKDELVLAQSGGSENAWNEITNGSSPYEIPKATNAADQITSVQVALRVTDSATAGSVWWDDVTLWKTGYLKQGLVEYLISAWNGLIGGLSVQPNGTATSTSLEDPWNFTLQAGAGAKGTANTGVSNAAAAAGAAYIADGKAVVADGKAVTADGKAVTADGKAVTADGKAVAADGKAVTADGKAVTADGKAVTADGKAVAADGKAVTADGKAVTAQTAAQLADSLATLSSIQNNLVPSPDCDDISVRRYSTTGYSVAYTTEQARSGNSLKYTVTTSGQPNIQAYLSPMDQYGSLTMYPVVPGQVYKYDMWIQAKSTNSGSGAMGLNFALYTIDGASSGQTITAQNVTPVKGTWQRVSGSFTIPATSGAVPKEPEKMMPQFYVASPVINDVYYIDRILIYR